MSRKTFYMAIGLDALLGFTLLIYNLWVNGSIPSPRSDIGNAFLAAVPVLAILLPQKFESSSASMNFIHGVVLGIIGICIVISLGPARLLWSIYVLTFHSLTLLYRIRRKS